MRGNVGTRERPKGDSGVVSTHRNQKKTAAARADFGERFLRPGGRIHQEGGGQRERRARASKGRARGGQGCLQSAAIKMGEDRAETATGEIEDDAVIKFLLFVFLFSFIIFYSGLQIK